MPPPQQQSGVFADFFIWVAPAGPPHSYTVSATSSVGGRATSSFQYDPAEVPLSTDIVQAAGNDPDLPLRKSLGRRFYDLLYAPDIRDLWVQAQDRAATEHIGLRLRLSIDDPDLSALPWELLYDGHEFLATRADTPLSRFLSTAAAPALPPQNVLRILVLVQDPGGGFAITPAEVDALEQALNGMKPTVDFKLLRNASIAAIQEELRNEYHVLHYLGHGDAARLFFAGEQKLMAMDDNAFSQLFSGRRTLRLVVLNACASAQASDRGMFSGVGPALVAKRIPAVVAMQYRFVQLTTASLFSKTLYRAIVNGLAIDAAVNEARQLISAGPLFETREWSTPVLYMSTPVGRLLDFGDRSATVASAWTDIRKVTSGSARAGAAVEEVTQTVREFLALEQELLTRDVSNGMKLLSLVRGVASAFQSCSAQIERAGNSPLSLPPFIQPLKDGWTGVEARALPALRAWLAVNPDALAASILDKAELVETSISQLALMDIVSSCHGFAQSLTETETIIERRVSSAIDQVLSASERTLGRLS
jgi:CHAT domain